MKKLMLIVIFSLGGAVACTKKASDSAPSADESMNQEMMEGDSMQDEMAVPEEEMQNFEDMDAGEDDEGMDD